MSGAVLVIRSEQLELLRSLAAEPLEQAAVLIVGEADTDPPRLLLREIHVIEERHFAQQTPSSLSIRSDGYMQALRRADQLKAAALFLHTHPIDPPVRSRADAIVDRMLEPVFVARTDRRLYGSLVLSTDDHALIFTGRIRRGGPWRSLDRIWAVGDRLRLISAFDAPAPAPPPEIFDRHMAAFGPAFQQLVVQLTIGVVGAGGTGSATTEQLVRLGVGRVVLFDHDMVTDTNLTRIHETVRRDVGRRKVLALARRLRQVGTGTRITPVVGKVTTEGLASQLRACDIVFGCTDDQGGRAVLARLAYRYLTPVFDMGVVIEREGDRVRSVIGRVTTMVPGTACLFCRGRIDFALLAAESLDDEEREARQQEGYAHGLPERDPAVVPYTTMISSLAVSEMVERIVAYDQPPPSELLLMLDERRVLPSPHTVEHHWCADEHKIWGRGDESPFLGRLWSA